MPCARYLKEPLRVLRPNTRVPVEIAVMHQLLDEFDASQGDPERLANINNSLHATIYDSGPHTYMQEALSNLKDALSLLQNTTFSLPERHKSASREHREIVAAIERRDSETAEATSRHHIREAQQARLRMLVEQMRTQR